MITHKRTKLGFSNYCERKTDMVYDCSPNRGYRDLIRHICKSRAGLLWISFYFLHYDWDVRTFQDI